MAGKAKSVYLTVNPIGSHTSVFSKMFFNASDFNNYIKSEEFLTKYPPESFTIIKEIY
jgi:hypothetical protein